jgi:hypothetical protein
VAPPISIPDIERLERNITPARNTCASLADEYFDEPGIDPLKPRAVRLRRLQRGPESRAAAARRCRQAGPRSEPVVQQRRADDGQKVGREPVQYVSNIYKNYIAYTLATEGAEKRAARLREAQRRN